MIRTVILALGLIATGTPAWAALVTETLVGRVQAVADATGVAVGDEVTTVVTFDDAVAFDGFYDVVNIEVTLPLGVVLDETHDALGLAQVSWDGARVTSLFATLAVTEGVYGFAGGELEFYAFGDGSLDFLVARDAAPAFEGTVVPLPAGLPLLVTGLAGLAWLRARHAAAKRG